jgi:DNA-directed RNA polymerase specialized sigma24 family protein
VYDAALRRVRNNFNPRVRQLAEDIAQDTVLAYLQASRAQVIDNPAAWANVTAWRLARKIAKSGQQEERPSTDSDELPMGQRWDLPDDNPERMAFMRFISDGQPTSAIGILRQQADLLMAQLDEQEREFVLLVASGYSQEEIADILGYANADVVKTTLNRKRKKLKDLAINAGVDPDWQDHPRAYD